MGVLCSKINAIGLKKLDRLSFKLVFAPGPTDYFMRGLTTWIQHETRVFMLLFKAVEEASIFIKSSSKLIALTAVSVYLEDVKGKNPILLYLKIKVPTMKSQLTLVKSLLAAAGIAAVSAVSAAPASAFSFGNIAGGDTSGDSYENSFTWDVVNQSPSVFFNASNSGNAADPSMFIRELFFDDKGYLSAPLVNIGNVGHVAFSVGASNDRLLQDDNGSTTDHDF